MEIQIAEDDKENEIPGKRFRNPASHHKKINKLNRERGLEYQTIKKQNRKTIPAKKFSKVICNCRLACHFTENEDSQKQIFQSFYSLLSWAEKTEYIQSHITVSQCKMRRKPENRRNIRFKKTFTRHYFFSNKDKPVCKKFFKQVLHISEGRIENCVKKMQNPAESNFIDRRGQHKSHKKTLPNAVRDVIDFIELLPKYESHYTRGCSSAKKKYLQPDLNLTKIYDSYSSWCKDKNTVPISKYMFRDTFYRKFNLRFKQPAQDTCDYCNKLDVQIKCAALKSSERLKLMEEKENHLQCYENIKREHKEYIGDSKYSGDKTVVLVFDLEKVFETPKLSTNSAYYKRKLSTYNLCVHDEAHNRTYMHVHMA